jgi:uncharacterized protein YuzE
MAKPLLAGTLATAVLSVVIGLGLLAVDASGEVWGIAFVLGACAAGLIGAQVSDHLPPSGAVQPAAQGRRQFLSASELRNLLATAPPVDENFARDVKAARRNLSAATGHSPSVTIADLTFDRVRYDEDADVLYLHTGSPADAVDFDESPEGHHLRFASDGQLIGITIARPRWLLENKETITITLPKQISIDRDMLREALTPA